MIFLFEYFDVIDIDDLSFISLYLLSQGICTTLLSRSQFLLFDDPRFNITEMDPRRKRAAEFAHVSIINLIISAKYIISTVILIDWSCSIYLLNVVNESPNVSSVLVGLH